MFGLCSFLLHLLFVTESWLAGAADHPGAEPNAVARVEVFPYPGQDGGVDVAEILVAKAKPALPTHDVIVCQRLHDYTLYYSDPGGGGVLLIEFKTSGRKKSETKYFLALSGAQGMAISICLLVTLVIV